MARILPIQRKTQNDQSSFYLTILSWDQGLKPVYEYLKRNHTILCIVGHDSFQREREASSLYYMHIKMTYIRLVISLFCLKVKYFWKDLIINCNRRVASLSTISLQHLFKLFCNLHETNIHAFFLHRINRSVSQCSIEISSP